MFYFFEGYFIGVGFECWDDTIPFFGFFLSVFISGTAFFWKEWFLQDKRGYGVTTCMLGSWGEGVFGTTCTCICCTMLELSKGVSLTVFCELHDSVILQTKTGRMVVFELFVPFLDLVSGCGNFLILPVITSFRSRRGYPTRFLYFI